jgi:hypothetical protein
MTDNRVDSQRPVVGLSACAVDLDGVPNHVCRANYVRAIQEAGCLPIILPAIGPCVARPELVDILDGVILTGSVSNVDPARYQQPRDPYVDGSRAARVFDGLIGSLASICPACWCGWWTAGQDGFPRCEFQTPQRPLQANGSHGFSRI